MRTARRKAGILGSTLLAVCAFSGCDQWGDDPTRPIQVTLAWEAPIDLDLLVDEQPAYRQGGSEDRQIGGSETFEVPRGIGTYVIAVQNLSGRGSARPVVTVEGAREVGGSPPSQSEPRVELQGEVLPFARRDCWVACEIDAERGTLRRIETWE